MQTPTHLTTAALKGSHAPEFPPLELENRPAVGTPQAAYYLGRQPQTLRAWACRDGSGPIRPKRVHGRLAWPLADIKKLLGVA
jgi:hypothetical protein